MAKKMISLKSSDGDIFEVEEAVASQSRMIQLMIEDGCAGAAIPLQNVTSEILVKIIEYCKRHAANNQTSCPSVSDLNKASSSASASASVSTSAASTSTSTSTDDLKKFDEEFVKVDWETLIGIILATNYLEIKSLLDLTCQAAADYIKDKTPEEVRTLFNIENDFTPEEEAEIRKEYAWAFE